MQVCGSAADIVDEGPTRDGYRVGGFDGDELARFAGLGLDPFGGNYKVWCTTIVIIFFLCMFIGRISVCLFK